MAEFASVPLSQVVKNGRMDAAFHVALDQVSDRVEQLRETIPAEEAIRRLALIPAGDKKPLAVLCRGGKAHPGAAAIDEAIREYPHIALALMERQAASTANAIGERIARDQEALRVLHSLAEPMAGNKGPAKERPKGFQAGWVYPLLDPEAYNDEENTGYGFAAIPHDATPETCWVHDAWLVDAEGNVHPGYSVCPVPIRLDSVDIAAGRPLEGPLPEPYDPGRGGTGFR